MTPSHLADLIQEVMFKANKKKPHILYFKCVIVSSHVVKTERQQCVKRMAL